MPAFRLATFLALSSLAIGGEARAAEQQLIVGAGPDSSPSGAFQARRGVYPRNVNIAETLLRISRETARRIEYAMQTVDALARRLVHPAERLRASRQHLAHLAARLAAATAQHFNEFRRRLDVAGARLESLGHDAVLARGYSVTLNMNDEIVRDASQVAQGERIVTALAKGKLESQVLKKLR